MRQGHLESANVPRRQHGLPRGSLTILANGSLLADVAWQCLCLLLNQGQEQGQQQHPYRGSKALCRCHPSCGTDAFNCGLKTTHTTHTYTHTQGQCQYIHQTARIRPSLSSALYLSRPPAVTFRKYFGCTQCGFVQLWPTHTHRLTHTQAHPGFVSCGELLPKHTLCAMVCVCVCNKLYG